MSLLAEAPELTDHAHGRKLAQDLIDRICLSADIADALFSVLSVHGGIEARLRLLTRALVRVFSAPGQDIEIRIDVDTDPWKHHAEIILQITHELVSNAVRHGLRGYMTGTIAIMLQRGRHDAVRLIVSDNGRGFAARAEPGEGLRIVQDLVARNGGTLTLPEPGRPARMQVYLPPGRRRHEI
ncbi:ATP-binding protein [Acidocella sp.]|uniref:ATP-binding protein n=1 Tax=Acidocella sp. TaxID=50710 RepID=UPI003D00DD4D